jgi:hypothetical protein
VGTLFSVVEHNKLTKKQEIALNSKINIVSAFYDADGTGKHTRTWGQLKELTGLSSGALSKHLKELLLDNVICRHKNWQPVRGKTGVHPTSSYEITGKSIEVEGKQSQTLEDDCRIYMIDKRIVGYQVGYLKKGFGGNTKWDKRRLKAKKKNPEKGRYFVPTTPVIRVNLRHQKGAR